MTTLILDSRHHLGQAYVCRKEAEDNEALKRSHEIEALVTGIDELTTEAFDAYVSFKEWQAVTESRWSEDPRLYSERVQGFIDQTCAVWCDIAKKLTRLMDYAESQGKRLANGDKFRTQYEAMLRVELMDLGAMPVGMLSFTEQTRTAIASGAHLESVGSAGF